MVDVRHAIASLLISRPLAVDDDYGQIMRTLKSHIQDHTLEITHSKSHARNHTLEITHSKSHTRNHTLEITHSKSHTRNHTLEITRSKSHAQNHTLKITRSKSYAQNHTLKITRLSVTTVVSHDVIIGWMLARDSAGQLLGRSCPLHIGDLACTAQPRFRVFHSPR
jgi:hypothetical protein